MLESVIRQAKNMYYNDTITAAGSDSRKLWGVINEVIDRKQTKNKIPHSFTINDKIVDNEKGISNGFNDYFASIGKLMADSMLDAPGYEQYLTDMSHCQFLLWPLLEAEVSPIMRKQPPKLSCGLDSINNNLVKLFHKELAQPMTIIINKLIEYSKVPSQHKLARIIPLYKKGAANEFGNHRPVSLLPRRSGLSTWKYQFSYNH